MFLLEIELSNARQHFRLVKDGELQAILSKVKFVDQLRERPCSVSRVFVFVFLCWAVSHFLRDQERRQDGAV